MNYGVVVDEGVNSAQEHQDLSFEDVLKIVTERLLSGEQHKLTIRRRCCSSICSQTISTEVFNEMRELAGACGVPVNEDNREDIIKKLDIIVNNWYWRGEISLREYEGV